jgi:UPF0755 protein
MPRLVRILIIPALLGVALIACAIIAYFALNRAPNPRLNPIEAVVLRAALTSHEKDLKVPAGTNNRPECFSVNPGDNATTIGANLSTAGFVKDAELFRQYVRYYGLDAQLQAGVFSLRQTLTIPEIAQTLTNVGTNTVTFQVIEGRRLEEIGEIIDRTTPALAFTGQDFLQLVGRGGGNINSTVQDFAARWGIPVGKSLEGFLFPDTYVLPACAKADELVARMLSNFDTRLGNQMTADAKAQNLTPYQVIILASIVEREAVIADERPTIASVYLNRLRKPMKLDADPTIQYALGNTRDASTWWPKLTVEDYQNIKDPFNTYINTGLPPGPIASPGLSSIQAVLHPATTNFIFFRATCAQDGRHNFAITLEEQTANACP